MVISFTVAEEQNRHQAAGDGEAGGGPAGCVFGYGQRGTILGRTSRIGPLSLEPSSAEEVITPSAQHPTDLDCRLYLGNRGRDELYCGRKQVDCEGAHAYLDTDGQGASDP